MSGSSFVSSLQRPKSILFSPLRELTSLGKYFTTSRNNQSYLQRFLNLLQISRCQVTLKHKVRAVTYNIHTVMKLLTLQVTAKRAKVCSIKVGIFSKLKNVFASLKFKGHRVLFCTLSSPSSEKPTGQMFSFGRVLTTSLKFKPIPYDLKFKLYVIDHNMKEYNKK